MTATNTKSVVAPLTRAQKARQGARPAVLDLKTKQPVSETASPLVPVPLDVDFNGCRYWVLFRPQDVFAADVDQLDTKQSLDMMRFRKESGLDFEELRKQIHGVQNGTEAEKELKVEEMIGIVPQEQLLEMLRLQNGTDYRADKIKCYAPHILDWNVPGEDGEDVADFSLEAFNENGGIYDAVLGAIENCFLLSSGRLRVDESTSTEKPSTTPEPSSTTGGTQSTVPAKESQATE